MWKAPYLHFDGKAVRIRGFFFYFTYKGARSRHQNFRVSGVLHIGLFSFVRQVVIRAWGLCCQTGAY